jgi:hypothetical protein
MRNVYEVLQEKENAIQRVAREIKILRLAAPLLTEDASSEVPTHDAHTRDVHSHDVHSHEENSHEEHTHDVRAHQASTEEANTYDTLINDVLGETVPTRDFPSDIRHDDANTGIVSAPSLLTNDLNDAESDGHDSDGQDEENSVPGTKISGRLKRLVRPLVSFVAG